MKRMNANREQYSRIWLRQRRKNISICILLDNLLATSEPLGLDIFLWINENFYIIREFLEYCPLLDDWNQIQIMKGLIQLCRVTR